jgi:hypothetical protein
MKHAIALNQEIQCENICRMVQKIVDKFIGEGKDISQAVLVLDIISVTESSDSLLPKLEYHPDV